jgi:hypothetical protein
MYFVSSQLARMAGFCPPLIERIGDFYLFQLRVIRPANDAAGVDAQGTGRDGLAIAG